MAAHEDSEQTGEMEGFFAPLGAAFYKLATAYDDAELRVIAGFVTRAADMLKEQAERLLEGRGGGGSE